MASSTIGTGALVTLNELNSASPFFKQGSSLRVTGILESFSVEDATAVIVKGNDTLKIDIQHLNLSLKVGSLFQFIGELDLSPFDEAIWKARVGRNVDGIDLDLYHQSLKLLREFISDQMSARVYN